MTGEYTMLDKDKWIEIPERHVHRSGNVYTGKQFMEGYEVRVFVRKLTDE